MSDELLSADDMRLIRVEWRAEAEDRIKVAISLIQSMRMQDVEARHLQDLMRTFHSLKGTAAMVGFRDVADFVHQLEDYCDLFRGKQSLPLSQLSCSLLEKNLMHLQGIVTRTDAEHDPHVGDSSILAELQATTQNLALEKNQPVPQPETPAAIPDPISWPERQALEEGTQAAPICSSCPFSKMGHPGYARPRLEPAELQKQLVMLNSLKIEPCVLIVGNETGLAQIVGELIQRILPRSRWVEVDSEAKALNLLTSVMGDQIDLVIIDFELSCKNDFTVLRALHELKSRGDIFANVLPMTFQNISEPDWKAVLQLGVRDFICKPFGVESLLTRCMGPIREAMISRLLVSIVSYSQRAWLGLNRLQREPDPQLQVGIQREVHSMISLMAQAQRNLQDAQLLPHA